MAAGGLYTLIFTTMELKEKSPLPSSGSHLLPEKTTISHIGGHIPTAHLH